MLYLHQKIDTDLANQRAKSGVSDLKTLEMSFEILTTFEEEVVRNTNPHKFQRSEQYVQNNENFLEAIMGKKIEEIKKTAQI